MHLIQILLPLRDNAGQPFPRAHYAEVRAELTERFGGLTAYSRAPAEGVWDEGGDGPPVRDDIVVHEVRSSPPPPRSPEARAPRPRRPRTGSTRPSRPATAPPG